MLCSLKNQVKIFPSLIFAILSCLLIIFIVGITHKANYNTNVGFEKKYEYAYTMQDTREQLGNFCKFPFLFFANYDVEDGIYNVDPEDDCVPDELNKYVNFSTTSVLTYRPQPITNLSLEPIRCAYQTNNGLSKQFFEIEPNVPIQIPHYNFLVSCKRNEKEVFVKPFVNFGVIPKEVPGESVAVILLPSINHMLFTKKIIRTKTVMQKNGFKFAQMLNMKETKPFLDLLLELGISSEISVFQQAKKHNFTTFFSGPQQIRELIDVDYDTMEHRNYISNNLIDENFCLQDGRKLMDDQLENMELFLESTSESKFFALMFLDDYGSQKSLIDFDLSNMFTRLQQKGIFKSTTFIVTTYNLSAKEVTDEQSKNPFFAVRLSDTLMKSHKTESHFLHLNFHRLLTTSNSYHLIMNLLDPKTSFNLSPFSLQSTTRSCQSENLSDEICLCMKPIPVPDFINPVNINFMQKLEKEFGKEIKMYKCVQSFEMGNQTAFFEYDNSKGKIRIVELSAKARVLGKRRNIIDVPLKKTFIYDVVLETFREFDYARIIRGHEVQIPIVSICVL
ncbi:uncharacterized protein CELE_F32G8.2 [Caenorhabditis elegans]|uniref:Transmembrane protein n=1 Tax=Caenorhabditis elegans TaxID=6239 RepID=Q19976_CAEEL|nr:Transmembrane protein [Caenorhabditis elegans]CAA96646.3 Transmembrane protein [Caenorhabditis elegans]|eukprot:NP_505706.3 Uncharacterized protein CELE_F32G8.2 [Caenorhabditis elegans]